MEQEKAKEEINIDKHIINKKVFFSVLQAVGILIYFAVLNFLYFKINQVNILTILEICSGIILLISLILMEIAYKKDSGIIAVTSIEYLVLAFHSLMVKHIINRYNYHLQFYLLTSSYMFSIYYVLKAIVSYTKSRKEYLKTLSDISEIIEKEEPIKKEATKKSKKKEDEKND